MDEISDQERAARLAGWTPEAGDLPAGEAAHALPPDVDPELGNNGVPAPEPGDPDHPDRAQRVAAEGEPS